ncbi:polysaccharide deacetylase family protein [Flavobacterium sp.]|uniref:polysaccharide deacetylase family protein n=1 Tax=Flavobacterium sp. TaxID=239 RepID=UPI0038FC5315
MKIFKEKKIILIWDFDGPIGQINSSYPYNFSFENFEEEINNVHYILKKLEEYNIKSCFAITGFSAEEGKYPYVFPELINEISLAGHEIASHSWRHEWTPIFLKKQIEKSLIRSKKSLEKAIHNKQNVIGFVPPHNRPMTWLRKGAFSIGDRGIFPFFKMGDNNNLINVLIETNYKWVRISYQNIFQKFNLLKKNCTGKVYKYNKILILENHYTGFDDKVINHILNTNFPTYTISAHPLMISFLNKTESKENFENFLKKLTQSDQEIQFVLPSSLI